MIRWGLVGLAWGAVVARAVIVLATGGSVEDAAREVADVGLVFALCMPVLGALADNRIGWLLIAIGVPIALHGLSLTWAQVALVDDPGSLPFGAFASWLSVWLWEPGWFLTVTLLPVLFPDARPHGGRRVLAWADAIVLTLAVGAVAMVAWPMRGLDLMVEPKHPSAAEKADHLLLGLSYAVGTAILGVLALISMVSLVVRFRRARGDERRQIAWVVYGTTVSIVISFVGNLPGLGGSVQVLESLALVGGLAIAMFRYRLYDIGVVVNRTLVYGGLTAILAAAYFVSVLLLQLLLSPSSDLAIAGSTLAVAALFRPARGRIQRVVDRRFYRHKYDATRTLEAFSARLRDEVALDTLGTELRGVVSETMQPAHVSLWLVRR